MTTTTIELTESQFGILHSLAKKTGKTEDQLAAEVLSKFIDQNTEPIRSEWLAAVNAAAGIWEDRDDLSEF